MCYMGRYTVSGSGADCKSVVFDSGGSTPSLPTIAMGFVASTCGTSFLDGGFLPTSSLILITHGIGNKCPVSCVYGAMVKRSRHLPFTEGSRVRFSVASPAISIPSLWIAITHMGYHVPNRDTPTPLKIISIILEIDIHIITLLKVIIILLYLWRD